jgi:hypothetical protein
VSADSINCFIDLVQADIPQINNQLHYIFDKIYKNNVPMVFKRYFTDVSYSASIKDASDKTKLCPLGIPTTIRRLIASHVAHMLPFNITQHESYHPHNAITSQKIHQYTIFQQYHFHKGCSFLRPHKSIQQCISTLVLSKIIP